MDMMISREDGKHLSHEEFMNADIFSLIETEMRIYNRNKKNNSIDVDSAIDLI